jgi:hypothetical protein
MIDTVEKLYSNETFVSYKITYENGGICIVPIAEDNTDYQAIQEWAAIEGNNIIDPGA